MRLYRADWNWFAVIALVWAGLLIPVYLPASFWLDVRAVHIDDSFSGAAPRMSVDRIIHRPFKGDWTATVMRKDSLGFAVYCTANGSADYRPDTSLPEDVNLNWWTWPTVCPLPPGTYLVKTLWVLHLPLFPDKEVRNTSNVFKVKSL